MNYRLELLKISPDRLSDRDLVRAATFVLAERQTLGLDRVHAVLRELYRRGMPEADIVRLTGFRLHVIFTAVHGRPPLPGVRVPR